MAGIRLVRFLRGMAVLALLLLGWAANAAQPAQPGQVVEVPAACVTTEAAEAMATAIHARDELATLAAAGSGSCLLFLGAAVPAYLLRHVTGPHGNASAWWSIWRARVGRALAFVVVRDWAL